MGPTRLLRPLLLAAALIASTAAWGQKQAPAPELKAAILVNMLLFVDWPETAVQPRDKLVVCHLENSPVSAALSQLDGKSFKGRPLQVLHTDVGRLAPCHALYLAPADAPALPALAASKGSTLLLVGDTPDFFRRGIMLDLDIDAGRVVFDVDLRAVRQAGLAMSSKVLRLARRVTE